ncbi:MAG: OmpA family protein [Nitrospirae bacterium]|nr:OmpA family protein [Nitrospirota bacterium]
MRDFSIGKITAALAGVALLALGGCATNDFVKQEISSLEERINTERDEDRRVIMKKVGEVSDSHKTLAGRVDALERAERARMEREQAAAANAVSAGGENRTERISRSMDFAPQTADSAPEKIAAPAPVASGAVQAQPGASGNAAGGNVSDERLAGIDSRVSEARLIGLEAREAARQARELAAQAQELAAQARHMSEKANQASDELRIAFRDRNAYDEVKTVQLLFGFNKTELAAEAKAALDEVAALAAGNKNAVVLLEGYTDGTGSPAYNLALSEKRVKSAMLYLAGEKGVSLYRVYKFGMGDRNPVESNKTKDGRKVNRRVTVRVMAPKS